MPDDLMGQTEIATMLGVTRQRAAQLTQRDDFPEPLARLAQGPVWGRDAVESWARETGRLN